MTSLEELKEVRIQKLNKLKSLGINPYPADSFRTHALSEALESFDKYEISADSSLTAIAEAESVTLSGRVMSVRTQGAITFFNLYDGTESFQGFYRTPKLDESASEGEKDIHTKIAVGRDLFLDTVDTGDFVEITGPLFRTKTAQPSMMVLSWRMLSKSLQPMPEKWHGLQDVEERYRKRYLDILSNPELKDLFIKKAKFWQTVRNFLNTNDFLEVETPTIEVTTGGAEAEPFKTHHNDLDLDVYMRISVGELWQKRLMAAGFPKTFEIGRAYRNEGTSPNHAQEFTNCEFYWSYADYLKGMDLVRDLYIKIALDVFGTTKFSAREHEFDLADEWRKISYAEEIKSQTGIDIYEATEEDLKERLEELGVKSDAITRERMVDSLWKYCRKKISGPAIVMDYPDFMQPLAKRNRNNPQTVEQFQVLIGGAEIGKGYSELNDPLDQRSRFEHQQSLLRAGDKEAMMPEWDFVEMLEHGMPPTFGFGFGERLFAFLVDKPLREVQMFPLMRPRDN
jgi:lysyl-tRNA synthetase, class II